MNDLSTNGQRISLRLFGGPILEVGGEPVRLSSYQACLLSIVYGHGGDGISRSRVIDLLWNEMDGPKQRHRLSQLMYGLKRKAGIDVILPFPLDRLASSSDEVACDLVSFHRHVEEQRLLEASAILGRPFLPLVDPAPTHEFDRWATSLPLTLRSTAAKRALALAAKAKQDNDWPRVARASEAALALEPESEATLRQLMHALSMAGRQREALAAFDAFSVDENGGARREVDPKTSALRDRIQDTVDDQPFGALNGGARPAQDARMCGRDDELAGILSHITGGASHGLTLHLISGEAGMGKTRLVSEVLQRARLQEFEVLTANCSELEQAIPLNAVLDCLRGPKVKEVVREMNDPWRAVMLSLLPEFREEGEADVPPPYVRPGSVPRRLYEAIHMVVSELTSERPMIMAIDNFQWADETSVSVLEFMTRRWRGGSLVLILSYRPTTHDGESAATRFLRAQETSREATRTHLEELPRKPSLELVQELSSEQGIDDGMKEDLAVLGCGNPFFLIELTQEHLAGRLERPRGPEVPNLPGSVRQIITERLRALQPAAVELLATLAVLGREARLSMLAALTDQTPDDLLDWIEDLERMRLVTTTATHVRLRHDLIQYTVYSELSTVRRAMLHRRIAEHLSVDAVKATDELALHFDRAGDQEQALKYALAAARRAEDSGAISEAINYLTIARRNAENDPRDHDILGSLAHLHYLHRSRTEAAPLLELAAKRYREAGELEKALKAEVERIDVLALDSSLEPRDLLLELDHCRDEAEANQYWEVLALALDVAVLMLERMGGPDRIRDVLGEVARVGRRGSTRAKCEAKLTEVYHVLHGDPILGLRSAREAVELAEAEGFVDLLFGCRVRLITALVAHGLLETTEGREATTRAESLAERSGDLHLKCLLQMNLGCWSLDIGELARARPRFLQAQQLVSGLDRTRIGIMLNLNLGELSLLENETDEAVDYFDMADELLAQSPNQRHAWIRQAGPGLAALRRGDLKEADARERRLPPLPSDWVTDPTLTILFLARQMERRGQRREALELLSSTADAVRDRWVTHSIRLHLEVIPRLAKTDPNQAQARASEVLEVAKALNLQKRVGELTRIIERLQ